ncbi:MazF family transcriptional regulator [Methylobacterium haplocladii]|uniref:SpoVT-AbrB domain-containing protein n=1 Tax=Methylobacterium haplocladii TaxID=1176176 RepID=A0A512IRR4_9HYPH|nr:MazF family transcriptional regulator [Methylobacterium haplocladii]GEP00376.1 hypothetical protein MHA02_27630 [Methylobacterium haplocladii]GJD85579.1 hypothetical protein HPGCJGGD_3468 [Methylobacterium haplocladii]GLS58488.1 hypothetical protein GCM10007887_11500 [Methylobacterium haplocladii]
MEAKVAPRGDDFVVQLSAEDIHSLGLREGQIVEIMPKRKRELMLADMIAEMDRLGPSHRPDVVDGGPDVGAEIIDDGDR